MGTDAYDADPGGVERVVGGVERVVGGVERVVGAEDGDC